VASANRLLGSWTVNGLPSGVAGEVFVRVTVNLDQNGILNATASHGNGQQQLQLNYYDTSVATSSKCRAPAVEYRYLRESDLYRPPDSDSAHAAAGTRGDSAHATADAQAQARLSLETAMESAKYKNTDRPLLKIVTEYERWFRANPGASAAALRAKELALKEALQKRNNKVEKAKQQLQQHLDSAPHRSPYSLRSRHRPVCEEHANLTNNCCVVFKKKCK